MSSPNASNKTNNVIGFIKTKLINAAISKKDILSNLFFVIKIKIEGIIIPNNQSKIDSQSLSVITLKKTINFGPPLIIFVPVNKPDITIKKIERIITYKNKCFLICVTVLA